MCGTRHTFANAQIKYFAGVAEYNGTQVQSEPAKVYAEWFPDRSWGIAHGYGTKHIPIANAVRLGLRLLVTKESNPRPIDRIVEFRKTANPTVCNAKCRSARGPMCDCSCGGRNHGISVVMSRTRFAASDLDFKPTAEMAANAARGLELREKHGKGGTAVGVARARDIKNRANLSPDTVKRMHSFFSRHEGNQAGGEDDAGYIAWLLWGGDAGKAWAARKAAQIDKSESARFDRQTELKKAKQVVSDASRKIERLKDKLKRQRALDLDGDVSSSTRETENTLDLLLTQYRAVAALVNGNAAWHEVATAVEKLRSTLKVYKSESARGAARKATMALNPVITDALKFHTQKMSDLLRQFVLEAKRLHTTYADLGAGKGFDSDWISEQRSIVDNAISAMARGNVTGASNIVRQWADEFFATYGHHEHSRNLSFLARAIAREPAHVVELAKAHKVTLSRRSRKATMARELVGSKGNKRIYLGGPDGSGKYNLYFVQVANTGVPGESPAEDLIELKQFATEAKARSAAQKMLSSRPGAKARFADQDPAKELLRVRIGSGTVSAKEFRDYAKQYVPGVSRSDSLADIIEKVNAALQRRGDSTRASMLVRGKDFSRPGAKVAFEVQNYRHGDIFYVGNTKVELTSDPKANGQMIQANADFRAAEGWIRGQVDIGPDGDVYLYDSHRKLVAFGHIKNRNANACRPGAKARFGSDTRSVHNAAKRYAAILSRTRPPEGLEQFHARLKTRLAEIVRSTGELLRNPQMEEDYGGWSFDDLTDEINKVIGYSNVAKRWTAVWLGNDSLGRFCRPGKSAFSLAAVKSAAAKVAAAYGTGEDSAVIRKHLDRIVSVLSGNTEGGRREAMGIHAQIGSVAERTHGRDFMWSAPMQGLESAIRSAGQFARPGAKAKFYTPPVKTGKNGPVTWDNLFVGHLGNGWTLANKGHEVNGDYERVANIAYGGEVTFAPGFNQARLDPRVKAYIQKLSVEAAQKKSAGEPLARTGSGQGLYSRARFANWEITPTKKHGQPIEEHTAKIGGKYFKIDTMPHLGADFGSLYVWDDLRGLKPIASGRIAALKRQAEALATNDALSRIILGEFSRPGAKSTHAAPRPKFNLGDKVAIMDGATVLDTGVIDYAYGYDDFQETYKYKVSTESGARKTWNEGSLKKMSRPGAKSNGLTLAQRIAVAHDAKRMALR